MQRTKFVHHFVSTHIYLQHSRNHVFKLFFQSVCILWYPSMKTLPQINYLYKSRQCVAEHFQSHIQNIMHTASTMDKQSCKFK